MNTLKEKIELFLNKSGFKIVYSQLNLSNKLKYGLLNPAYDFNICNWYTEEELILFLELYFKEIESKQIEETINILRIKSNLTQTQKEETLNDQYANSILELIKAVTNLKEFSLTQQQQLINNFKQIN